MVPEMSPDDKEDSAEPPPSQAPESTPLAQNAEVKSTAGTLSTRGVKPKSPRTIEMKDDESNENRRGAHRAR